MGKTVAHWFCQAAKNSATDRKGKHTMTTLYHGLLADVSACKNDAQAIADMATLNWAASKIPLYMDFGAEGDMSQYTPSGTRQRYAIVNSRNNAVIDGGKPVGKDFKLIDNQDILTDACEFATETGMEVKRAGAVEGGSFVVIEAEFPGLYNLMSVEGTYQERIQQREAAGLRRGDAVSGGVTIIASHQPGKKTRVRSFLRRLSCMNGMTVHSDLRALALSHRSSYDSKARETLQRMMQEVSNSFSDHVVAVDTLTGCAVNREVQKAHVIGVTQPELLTAVMEETIKRGICGTPRNMAAFVIDELASKDAVKQLLDSYMADTGKRVLDSIINILDTQPGVEHCRGTLAQSYHAVTHHFDHNYGRKNNPDSAVMFALTGKGDEIKTAALTFGLELVQMAGKA